ncbi:MULTISPECIES: aminoglycoside phosphotransferase family protein [unclassified Rhizobium]|uniref:aminoglycoside phosphotransferase family protein n=1 Tax=unclassified Rhizobium TaxID=2613769 RepID=UPI000EAA53CE|nr:MULTISPECIES: aminoglycoside phosphotransferase family protein [unclassified Rhizobium]AYG68560.1 3'-kinase [Rhizobium sp. CCGE531]AYG74944.1 3'-kinase [Rhizobium sp. CCGE532]
MSEDHDSRAYFDLWRLIEDGTPIITHSSRLFPVRRDGEPAMLKIAVAPEEKSGAALMVWWNGVGAARVLEHKDDAILLERATGSQSLADMARNGQDDEASRIICAAVAGLHAPRGLSLPQLIPLADRFRSLEAAACREGGVFARTAATARALLSEPRDVVTLHGDIHHGNILDFAERGWLAIDPKGLVGERGFDYANLFCNPNNSVATTPGRLARQVDIVAEAARLERQSILRWIIAWAGLSAAWLIKDGEVEHVRPTLRIADIAAAELGGMSL